MNIGTVNADPEAEWITLEELSASERALIVLGISNRPGGRFGDEIVYSVGIDGIGRRRFSLTSTPRRVEQARAILAVLETQDAAGYFRVSREEWTGKDGEPAVAWILGTAQPRPSATPGDYVTDPDSTPIPF